MFLKIEFKNEIKNISGILLYYFQFEHTYNSMLRTKLFALFGPLIVKTLGQIRFNPR